MRDVPRDAPARGRSPAATPPVATAMAEVDWPRTPLGAPASWPSALQDFVRVLLGSRFSMWMAWGPELTFFCNDAYAINTLGVKYPWALGRSAAEVWAEIWHDIGPRIEHVLATGEATWDEDLLLFLERSGYREETYHTFSYSPLFRDDAVVGMLCVVSEETERVIGERRMRTLRELNGDFAAATTEADVAAALSRRLGANPCDVPFSMTYLVDDGGEARLLAATGGTPTGGARPLVPASVPADAWPLDAMAVGEHRIVERLGDRFDALPTGAWDAPPDTAIVVALGEAGQPLPSGYLVAGLNPYRRLERADEGFVSLIARQVTAAVSNVRAFEAERRRAEALAEIDRAKTAFFTNISHEFRTPLTLMLGPLEDVLGRPGTIAGEARERLEVAHRNGLRMLKLVNALLDFARIEGGHLTAAVEPVDVGRLTAEIAGMFRSAIEDAGMTFRVACDDGPPALIDPDMWELIVTNLLSNAFKHTFVGEIAVRLSLTAHTVQLVVRDTGAGIPADELPQLFGRFHRVQGAPSRSHEGSGVGLSLVHELVGLHDGTIDVASEIGEGTTFTVTVPLVRTADDAPPQRASTTASAAAQPGGAAPSRAVRTHVAEVQHWAATTAPADGGDSGRATILVVDDNADMRSYLGRLLSGSYSVHTAADGADALEQLARSRPDLIISDVMMPNVDGFHLVRRLRRDEALGDVPVILLSARAGPESSVEGLELGADDYLVKPFSSEELLGRVAARLAGGMERRRARIVAGLAELLRDLQDPADIAAACHAAARDLLGHDQTMVAVRHDERVHAAFHPPLQQGIGQRYHSLAVDSDTPLTDAIVGGTVVLADSAQAFVGRYPHLEADHLAAGLGAIVVSPVCDSVGGRVGSLGFAWRTDRPLDPDTVATIGSLAVVVGRAVERAAFIANERRIADAIQHQLLDVRPRSDVAVVATRYRTGDPSMMVGGDWYDAFAVGEHRLGLAVGDVVGHGLGAALVMSQLRSALSATASAALEPALAMGMVDRFADRVPGGSCTTAAYVLLERREDGRTTMTWCAAGHPPPIVAEDGRAELLWEGRRSPLGVHRVAGGAQAARTLEPGSLVVLYSDGLVERRGEPLDVGFERLRRAVQDHGHLPVDVVCDRLIEAMTPPAPTSDDLVVLAARVRGSSATNFVDIVPATSASVPATRHRLRDWLATEPALAGDATQDVLLAVGEAVANAIEHGSPSPIDLVAVEVVRRDGRLVAAVSDTGSWATDSAHSIRRGRGRGLAFMEHFARVHVHRHQRGSTVVLDFGVIVAGGLRRDEQPVRS